MRQLPSQIGPFVVWVQLTDGNGDAPFTIEIERVGSGLFDDESLWMAGHRAHFRDPRVVLDYRLLVPSFTVPHEGLYRITLSVHDSPLAVRYFVVTQVS